MPFASEILFPVDFSPSSEAMIPAVAALAKRWQAPVTVLHAGPAPDARLANYERLASTHESIDAPPAAAIVERAARMNSPLIMMPTRGETMFRQLLLGSVTASVLHDAPGPVWTSAHCADGGPLPEAYASIVCAVDLGARTPDVMRAAAAFAADFGAAVHNIHSIPAVDPRFESATANRAHAFLVNAALEEYPSLEIVTELDMIDGIVNAVKRHRADLLVIGRGVMQGVLGRLRTNAHELIRRSPCPVLSV